jgi:transcriptional regulator with XRE-family HTH domain
MTFADKLRQLRSEAGLSREELADACGLARGTVRDYEQGKRKPTLESAVKLAASLGTDCRTFAECEDVRAVASTCAPRGRPPKTGGATEAPQAPVKRRGRPPKA